MTSRTVHPSLLSLVQGYQGTHNLLTKLVMDHGKSHHQTVHDLAQSQLPSGCLVGGCNHAATGHLVVPLQRLTIPPRWATIGGFSWVKRFYSEGHGLRLPSRNALVSQLPFHETLSGCPLRVAESCCPLHTDQCYAQ